MTGPESTASRLSRPMWEAVERFHGVCYVAPEVRTAGAEAGLKGFWMNYFATRIAPVGPVGPEIVQATFFYYGPQRIHRAIPEAWRYATREAILAARYRGVGEAIRRLHPDPATLDEMAEAAELVRIAASAAVPIGRVIYAGWASLDWPTDPGSALWHGCTLLREYRSGNHLIALAAAGLDGCEAVVSHVAAGGAPRVWIHDEAAWGEADEAAAVESLQLRGWLDADGRITAEGLAGRRQVEELTDELDARLWEHLGADGCRRLGELMDRLNAVLPPDDQLDWQQVYGADGHS